MFDYKDLITNNGYICMSQSEDRISFNKGYYIGTEDYYQSKIPTVELRKSDREYSLDNFKATVIIIPEYVETIEAGVFDGLTDVTIKTSYETKPEGWADGWNGNCEVVWGADID